MWFEIFCGLLVPILLYVLSSYIGHLLECRKFPLGPFPLPIFGNLHSLEPNPHKKLTDYSKRYGSIFSVSFGSKRIIVVSEIQAVREALVQKDKLFAGRPKNYLYELASSGYKDVAFMDYGPLWKLMRQVSHTSLKTYGKRCGGFETFIAKESEELHKRLQIKSKNPLDLHTEFGASVLNVVYSVTFGKRYQYSDPEFKFVLNLITKIGAGLSSTSIVTIFPWVRYLPFLGVKEKVKELQTNLLNFRLYLKDHLKKYKETFDENNIQNFTDSIIKLSKDKISEKHLVEEFTNDHLEQILADMFVAGTDTSLTSLLWLVLYMIHYPRYQDEIYEEIISTIGTNRYPCLKDRDSLHLVKASLKESLRLSTVSPFGIPHKTMTETSLTGYIVPKDTTILINIWSLHNDTNHWESPEKFNPYRWMSEDKKFDSTRGTSYLPFSAGSRVCLGKTMAEATLFLFFTKLIRDFKFESVPGCALPSLVGKFQATLAPEPFKALLVPRVDNLINVII